MAGCGNQQALERAMRLPVTMPLAQARSLVRAGWRGTVGQSLPREGPKGARVHPGRPRAQTMS